MVLGEGRLYCTYSAVTSIYIFVFLYLTVVCVFVSKRPGRRRGQTSGPVTRQVLPRPPLAARSWALLVFRFYGTSDKAQHGASHAGTFLFSWTTKDLIIKEAYYKTGSWRCVNNDLTRILVDCVHRVVSFRQPLVCLCEPGGHLLRLYFSSFDNYSFVWRILAVA